MASWESSSPPIPMADEHGQEDHRDHTDPVAAVDTENTDAKLAEVKRILFDDDEWEGINNVSEDQMELPEQQVEDFLHVNEVEVTAPRAAEEEQPKQDSFNGNHVTPAFPSLQEHVVARHSQKAMMTMHQQQQQQRLGCLYGNYVPLHCSPIPRSSQDWSNQTQEPHLGLGPFHGIGNYATHLPKFSSFQHPIQMQESAASSRSSQTRSLQSQQVNLGAKESATSSQAQALQSQLANLAAQESAAFLKAQQAQQVIAAGQESHSASYESQHQPDIAKEDPGLYYAIGDYVPPDFPPHPIIKQLIEICSKPFNQQVRKGDVKGKTFKIVKVDVTTHILPLLGANEDPRAYQEGIWLTTYVISGDQYRDYKMQFKEGPN